MRAAQLVGGAALYVLDEDPRGDALVSNQGNLNPLSLQMWRLLCDAQPWTTVLDVGANYGEMILGAVLPATARVFAFEPAPKVAACLRASVAEAGLAVEVVELAVGASTGPAELFEDPMWSGTTTATAVQATPRSTHRAVQMTRLDDFLAARASRDNERYLVKIDVEGGERQVLEGFLPLAADSQSATFQIEVLHTSEEDLRWMIRTFILHLVSRADTVPVPVATVEDYRRLLDSGAFYEQDAILSTHFLNEGMAPGPRDHAVREHSPLDEVTRERDILRAGLASTTMVSGRALERATAESVTAAAEAEANRSAAEGAHRDVAALQEIVEDLRRERAGFLASRSWRLTRPVRALSRRLRPDS